MLEKFKKANQAYKQKLAEKAGFKTIQEYRDFLVGPQDVRSTTKSRVGVKPTIHLVDILDASGSMEGGKYNNSKAGILKGLVEFRKEQNVHYTYTLIEFLQSRSIKEHSFLGSLDISPNFAGARGDNTPLYRTVFDSLNKLKSTVNMVDKVLVKVYTDGGDNSDLGYTAVTARLIKELQEQNFTVTFVATDRDLRDITRDLNLDDSNTLAVTNDAAGFQKAFDRSIGATTMYSSKVQRGEDVSLGFYKQKGTL